MDSRRRRVAFMSKTAKRTRRHPVMRVVCLMLFAVLLALVAPAGAQATWGAPETLSDASQNANFPQVAVDPNGDAVFVWQHYDGTTDCGGYACRRVESRYRSAAGVLSATDTLSGPATNTFYPPKVGVDSNGNAVFAWVSRDETTDCGRGYGCLRIRVRARSAAGVLSATQTVSERGAGASLPDIAVDTNGDAVVVWIRAGLIQARARSAAGTLSAVQTLSDSGGFPNFPEVGIDQTGNAVFAWQRYDGTTKCGGGPGCQRVQARTRSAAGARSAIQTLSDSGQDAQAAQV